MIDSNFITVSWFVSIFLAVTRQYIGCKTIRHAWEHFGFVIGSTNSFDWFCQYFEFKISEQNDWVDADSDHHMNIRRALHVWSVHTQFVQQAKEAFAF